MVGRLILSQVTGDRYPYRLPKQVPSWLAWGRERDYIPFTAGDITSQVLGLRGYPMQTRTFAGLTEWLGTRFPI
jgi:hypothetical protein